MTRYEITEWMKAHKCVFHDGEYDERSNYYSHEVYEGDDGKFYRIDFCNESPTEEYDAFKGRTLRGVFKLREVTKKIRTIELEEWS